MTRLKFLLFALVVTGLWAYHLMVVSPLVTEQRIDGPTAAMRALPAHLALELELRRSELESAVIRVAASPGLVAVAAPPARGQPSPSVVSAERLATLTAAAREGLSPAYGEELVVAFVQGEDEGLFTRGSAPPQAPPEGTSLAAAAPQGGIGPVAGTPHWLFSIPLRAVEKAEVREAAQVVLGLPVLGDAHALTAALARDQGLLAVGILSGDVVIAASGNLKGDLKRAAASWATGAVMVVEEAEREVLGPVRLPLLVRRLPAVVGYKAEIPATPLQVAALAQASSGAEALAAYQKFALFGLLGLVLLTLGVAVALVGPQEEEDGGGMVMPQPMPLPPAPARPVAAPPGGAISMRDATPMPEASPEDFVFPSSPSRLAAPTTSAPAPAPPARAEPPPPSPARVEAPPPPPARTEPVLAEPPRPTSLPGVPAFASAPPFGPPPFAPPQPRRVEEDPFARAAPPPSSRTTAPAFPGALGSAAPGESTLRTQPPAPAHRPTTGSLPVVPLPGAGPATDPFALVGHGRPADSMDESTRVGQVPPELLSRSRLGGLTGEHPAVAQNGPSAPPPKVGAAGGEEERHFLDVFREFVATREKCGEPADGLTFEKFRAKLLKNKEQLMAKYACKTVKFQVYVKEGKAALKATPVKD